MKLDDLIKTVEKIDLISRTNSKQKLAGDTLSAFRGQGVVFDSIRKYEEGDDVRNINWKATARFRETYVNIFSEDKVRTVWILIDISGSSTLGSARRSKIDLEIEMAATLAYSAIRQNDAVGVIFFTDEIKTLIRPIRGMAGFWHIAKTMVDQESLSGETSINSSLDFLMKINCSGSIIFIVSDFMTQGFEYNSAILAQHNEMYAIRVYDNLEQKIPNIGWVRIKDVETGKQKWVNTSSANFKKEYQKQQLKHVEYFEQFILNNAISSISVRSDEDVVEKLVQLMR